MFNPEVQVSIRFTVLMFMSLLIVNLTGCELNNRNFSQYPGFDEYFSKHPRSHELPGPEEQALLDRFRPRFMLSEGQPGPIDFYRDYIANGVLRGDHGSVISTRVTRELLNAHKDKPDIVFQHHPGEETAGAVVYGRIDRESVFFNTEKGQFMVSMTFLTYHIVFPHSGIPAGIPAWQESVLGLFFDIDDWHQLDHYTAVTVILSGNESGGVHPAAVMLQQHDNLRTYLVGEGIVMPDDGRIVVDIAKRSNELFPHHPGLTKHRAVYMPEPKAMRFLLSGEKKPFLAGYDVTEGAIEVNYALEFLPHDDAFYTFKGFLGERRWLKGRDAPPGADYNTLPELKPLSLQLFSGYWRENNPGDIKRLEKTIFRNEDFVGFAKLQGAEFYRNWKQIKQNN
jgi:hypothetical protein